MHAYQENIVAHLRKKHIQNEGNVIKEFQLPEAGGGGHSICVELFEVPVHLIQLLFIFQVRVHYTSSSGPLKVLKPTGMLLPMDYGLQGNHHHKGCQRLQPIYKSKIRSSGITCITHQESFLNHALVYNKIDKPPISTVVGSMTPVWQQPLLIPVHVLLFVNVILSFVTQNLRLLVTRDSWSYRYSLWECLHDRMA